ncbi:MAG TPA: o-succinylbenzoate synthase [Gemmatimonadaceae bacterium]
MIHLVRILLREIRLPLLEPFRTSTGVVAERRVVLLELTDASGAVAWSECVAEAVPSYSPDTVDGCWLAIGEWLAPRVLGRPFAGARQVHAALTRGIRGHHMARAAVEMGCWGIESVLERQPLAVAVGRGSRVARERGAPPRDLVPTGISLGIQPTPEALAQRAAAELGAGYRRVKMKIEPGHDVEFVGAVREATGPSASLTADANSAYSLHDPAHLRALEALDAFALTMIEQPLAHDDLVRHAELQRRIATPICLDESITSDARAEDMITLGAGRVINVKPGRVGGFTESLAIHDRCVPAGVPLWCGGMLETGIGRAYNVALASLPGFTEPGDLSPSARYWARDVVQPAWTMEDGCLRVPLDRPGIGVDVDVDFIDDLTVRAVALQ